MTMTGYTPLEGVPERFQAPMDALCKVARDLSRKIALGPLAGELGAEVGSNLGGDTQKALDVLADEAFVAALAGSGVRWYASEERDDVLQIDNDGALALAIDPLDGSSNIDKNVSIGTIFAILKRVTPAGGDGTLEDALQPGMRILSRKLPKNAFTLLRMSLTSRKPGNGVETRMLPVKKRS